MSQKDLVEFAALVGAVVVGVIVAGYVMSSLRGSVGLIADAHAGFDS